MRNKVFVGNIVIDCWWLDLCFSLFEIRFGFGDYSSESRAPNQFQYLLPRQASDESSSETTHGASGRTYMYMTYSSSTESEQSKHGVKGPWGAVRRDQWPRSTSPRTKYYKVRVHGWLKHLLAGVATRLDRVVAHPYHWVRLDGP